MNLKITRKRLSNWWGKPVLTNKGKKFLTELIILVLLILVVKGMV